MINFDEVTPGNIKKHDANWSQLRMCIIQLQSYITSRCIMIIIRCLF